MKILLIADPHIPVPPIHYGGTERIVALYAQEFSRLGNKVHLMAGPDSKSYGGRLHTHRAPSKAYLSRARRKISFQLQSLWAARDCDVVFNHGRFDYLESLLRIGIPIVHLAHNPLDATQIQFIEGRVQSSFLLCGVSHNQLSHAPTSLDSLVVHNFVDTAKIKFSAQGSGYLAFIGRLTENKGVHTAIKVARMLGKKLHIAGTVSNELGGREYFQKHVEPEIDNRLIFYLGPVNDDQKQNLLCGADALLFPTQWQEPCAIVISESLACGTPVVAFNIASNSELIKPGITGELCSDVGNVNQMASAVNRALHLSRQACREEAERKFDVRVAAPILLNEFQKLTRKQSF